ncbi:hypothetical protein Zmor_015954 [Zophobas morio]|uniref:Uncharacterized protein n=1 Tax=Zophobas morio TaxID=2755281 RepID=A0AA38IPB6_9CUCU|nr:hypothetical protein Zmor_015954 [Zophobas morio]
MRSSLLNLLLCIFLQKLSNSEKITFENVTVLWRLGYKVEKTVATSENLKKIIPDEEQVSVEITGNIPILYENSVLDIPNLNRLELFVVGLEEIKPRAFGNLPLLETLLLSWNNLTQIKTDTFVNLNISYVDLSYNSIILLEPGAFKNFNADHLKLNNNKLTKFPSGVFDNVTLEILSLCGNFLHTIAPKALSTLSLKILSLYDNKFDEIDPEVFDVQELKSLDLDFNSIKLLRPGDLKNLPELNVLRLVDNKLEEIPEGVFNATKLTYLDLSANKIAKIGSKALDDMSKLQILHIDFNNLTLWDNNWLSGVSPPVSISVSFNQITEIPDEAFKNYPHVGRIDLHRNYIGRISAKAFDKLEHVDYLDLTYNQIDNWNPDLLGDVTVGTLDLTGNKLECVEGDLKTIFKNVEYTILRENPWSEECVKKVEEFIHNQQDSTGGF